MRKKEDLTGRKFGRLTVLSPSDPILGRAAWNVVCDCGIKKSVIGYSLSSGRTLSCGCCKKEILSEKYLESLIGKRFGRLTVISRADNIEDKTRWLCQCDCGVEKVALAYNLKNGNVSSCGCLHAETVSKMFKSNLLGMTFGLLEVVGESGRDKWGGVVWGCKCSCGNMTNVSSSRLISGNTKSCGCFRKNVKFKHGMSGTKEYSAMHARMRLEKERYLDTEWNIEKEMELIGFYPKCVLCGGSDRMATDHVFPLSEGYGLKIGNAIRLCEKCNSKKGRKLPKNLPDRDGDIILHYAKAFRDHWENMQVFNAAAL